MRLAAKRNGRHSVGKQLQGDLAQHHVEGLITGSTSGKMAHVHPAVRIEKDARAEFRRIWGQLSLDWNYRVDGR